MKRKKHKVSAPTTTTQASTLGSLLKKIYVGGAIGECVLEKAGKHVVITAIDHNNILWVNARAPIELPHSPLGLADVNLLIKYLPNTQTDINMTVKHNRLIVTQGGSKLKYLLTDPELISVQSDMAHDVAHNAMGEMLVEVPLRPGHVDEFLRTQSVLNREVVSITATKKGKVLLQGGLDTEHQYEVSFGKWKPRKKNVKPPVSLSVHTKFLVPILSCLEFPETEKHKSPMLYFSKGLSLIQAEHQKVSWAIFHVEE